VNTGLLVAIIVIVVIVLALAWVLMRQQRTARLRKQFGPEYERAVSESGSRQAAEAELEDRRARHEKFEIVALDPGARERYLEQWRLVQAQFVDSPPEATRAADRLINQVMRERGYPVEEFEQRAADISVDHPQVVDDYRAAHTVAEANERSEASTEDLRQALVHYRSLFEDLLETAHGDASVGLHETSATRADAATEGVVADRDGVPADRDGVPAGDDAALRRDETAHDEAVREHEAVRHEGGTTDVRPPGASTPPERRTTEEAR
jgi:cytoskeletal protein RodZ